MMKIKITLELFQLFMKVLRHLRVRIGDAVGNLQLVIFVWSAKGEGEFAVL